MLCQCGHPEERHAGMHDSKTGPCMRCNCSGFQEAALESVDTSNFSNDEFEAHRHTLLRNLGSDAA